MTRPASPARARGQSAVIVALALPFLISFSLLVLELAGLWLRVAQLEDALQQAARSAVQTLDYAALARGGQGLRVGSECRAVTADAPGPCRELLEVANRYFLLNLRGVDGLDEPPEAVAARVRWTVLPQGGACAFSLSRGGVAETTPLICAEVRPRVRGLAGWDLYSPLIVAAETLDLIRQPA